MSSDILTCESGQNIGMSAVLYFCHLPARIKAFTRVVMLVCILLLLFNRQVVCNVEYLEFYSQNKEIK